MCKKQEKLFKTVKHWDIAIKCFQEVVDPLFEIEVNGSMRSSIADKEYLII